MFPTTFNWAPRLHWPLSGPMGQIIAPVTDWFFGRITPGVGDQRIEQRAFEEVASYGTQIGLLTKVLMNLVANDDKGFGEEASQALAELERIKAEVDEIKIAEREGRQQRLDQAMRAYKASDPGGYRTLIEGLPEPEEEP